MPMLIYCFVMLGASSRVLQVAQRFRIRHALDIRIASYYYESWKINNFIVHLQGNTVMIHLRKLKIMMYDVYTVYNSSRY